MDALIISALISLVAIATVALDRKWQQRKAHAPQPAQADASTSATHTNMSEQNNNIVKRIKEVWRIRLGRQSQPAIGYPKIRDEIVALCADQPLLQGWLNALSASEFGMLQQRLQTFCTAQQIDLDWLGEPALAKDAALQTALHSVILHFLAAEQQVNHVQNELQAFHLFQLIERRPYSYEYQPLLQQLYAQVVKTGLAAPVRADALLATEKIRVQHMLLVVQTAADANRPAFYRIVNALRQSDPQENDTLPMSADGSADGSDPQPVALTNAA